MAEAFADLLPQEFLKNTYTLERCQDWAVRYPQNILIAVMDDKVVGFACYGSSSQEDLQGAGELYALYVLADYYDQEIGYQLMQAALEKLQSYETVTLWVLEGNARAITFYEKVGFQFDGVKKNGQFRWGTYRVPHGVDTDITIISTKVRWLPLGLFSNFFNVLSQSFG